MLRFIIFFIIFYCWGTKRSYHFLDKWRGFPIFLLVYWEIAYGSLQKLVLLLQYFNVNMKQSLHQLLVFRWYSFTFFFTGNVRSKHVWPFFFTRHFWNGVQLHANSMFYSKINLYDFYQFMTLLVSDYIKYINRIYLTIQNNIRNQTKK